MSAKRPHASDDEAKQKTLKGAVIPLPTRDEIMDAFRKIARPAKPKKG